MAGTTSFALSTALFIIACVSFVWRYGNFNSCALTEFHESRRLQSHYNERATEKLEGMADHNCSAVVYVHNESSLWPAGLHSSVTAQPRCNQKGQLDQNVRAFEWGGSLKSKEIILIFGNLEVVPLILNLLQSIREVKVSMLVSFLVVAMDAQALKLCSKLKIPAWYPPLFDSVGPRYSDFGSLEFRESLIRTTTCIKRFLELGYNVFLTDVDIVWLRDSYPYIMRSNATIWIGGNKVDQYNTGWYHSRANDQSVSLFGKIMTCTIGDDQHCFNKYQGQYEGLIEYIPKTLFPTTGCAWKRLTPKEKEAAYVFHASCNVGMKNKLMFYCQNGMFRIDMFRNRTQRDLCPADLNEAIEHLNVISSPALIDVLNRLKL